MCHGEGRTRATFGFLSFHHHKKTMASVFPALFVLVVVVGLMMCAWLFTPKGDNQTYACWIVKGPPTLTGLQSRADSIVADIDVLLSHVDGNIYGTITSFNRYV